MRVLLQNTETKLFFINTNEWTNDPLKATDFEEVDRAAQAYHSQDLVYAQIVIEPGIPDRVPQVVADLLRPVHARHTKGPH